MSTRSARYSLFTIANKNSDSLAVRDRDAMAFIDAAELGDDLHQYAIRELVRSLKRADLWSKMKAIYPFIGGTASAHKWNLKDPRDLDAAFRLSFNGGWTHSSTGAKGNGTTGFANTFLTPSLHQNAYNTHMSFYSRTNDPGTAQQDMGVWCGSENNVNLLILLYGGERQTTSDCYANPANRVMLSGTRSDWYAIQSRVNSTDHRLYQNGVQIGATNTAQSTNFANINKSIYIGARNNNDGGAAQFSRLECAFASIGDGLTSSDATSLNRIVQRYQTTLGRNV